MRKHISRRKKSSKKKTLTESIRITAKGKGLKLPKFLENFLVEQVLDSKKGKKVSFKGFQALLKYNGKFNDIEVVISEKSFWSKKPLVVALYELNGKRKK